MDNNIDYHPFIIEELNDDEIHIYDIIRRRIMDTRRQITVLRKEMFCQTEFSIKQVYRLHMLHKKLEANYDSLYIVNGTCAQTVEF